MLSFPRRFATVLTIALAVVTLPTAAGAQEPTATPTPYVKAEQVCTSHQHGKFRCLAERLVRTQRGVPGARPMTVRPGYATGPAGGYTPGELAAVYGANPALTTSQKVAVVDAFDDPNALTDLNTFNAQYALPAETAASFRKYSQTGSTSVLPTANAGWAGEEALDIQTVRGICHQCAILLVEANSDSDSDLAAAENEAVKLGATVITNSFGEAETGPIPTGIAAAFNHPGVVITAGTGDDGMYSWDQFNQGLPSANAPYFPASLNTVVAVGGTTLQLNTDSSRASETVWNENGDADFYGQFLGPLGATGGGCSTQVDAQRWQTSLNIWPQTNCGKYRLPADVSAIADPYSGGLDVYDSYQSSGWQTVGGTSLSSPLIAAMWALAGGSGGVTYPALSLYGHSRTSPSSLYDVTIGGSGFCGGLSAADCEADTGQSPNTLGFGTLDCAFLPNSEQTSTGTRACDAGPGYDGPSGLGAPSQLTLFKAMNPTATITAPTTISHGKPATFTSTGQKDPFPGGYVATHRWSWGDGTTSTGTTATHTFVKAGNYLVTLLVTDNYQRSATTTRAITAA